MKNLRQISLVRNRWLASPQLHRALPKLIKEWEIRDLLVDISSGTRPCTSCCTQCASNCCNASEKPKPNPSPSPSPSPSPTPSPTPNPTPAPPPDPEAAFRVAA